MCMLELLLQPFELGFLVQHEFSLSLQQTSQCLLGSRLLAERCVYCRLLLSLMVGLLSLCSELMLLLWVIRKGLEVLELLAKGLQLGLDALQLSVLSFFRDGRECHKPLCAH